MFQLAISGLGPWGQRLVTSVQGKSDAVRFAAAVNRTPSKVADFAARHAMRLGADLAPVLADKAIDGIVIAGPAHLHAEQAMAVLDAGKHALVIKPLAMRERDAEALYTMAEKRGLTLALGYDRCFLPAVDELRRRVKAGDLGRTVHAEADFCVDRYFDLEPGDWKSDRAISPPGALADHWLYVMIELLGPVTTVQAKGLNLATALDVADTSSLLLQFASGASGALTAIGVTANFHRLHVFGTKGWAEIRGGSSFIFQPIEGKAVVTECPAVDLLRRELEAFAAAAEGRVAFPVTPRDAIAGVATLEAMGRSAASGQPVTL